MKTKVTIHFPNGYSVMVFDMDIKTFMQRWNNQIPAVGYFTNTDDKGNTMMINPSHCGMIEITETE